MTLQVKYEVRQFGADAQQSDGIHLHANVLITAYDDVTGTSFAKDVDIPDYLFSALPANIQATLVTLRDEIIAALKTRYNSSAVTLFTPPTSSQ